MGTYVVQDDVRRLEESGSGDIAGQAGDSNCEIRLGSDCREQARRPRVSTTGLSSHLSSRQSPQNKTKTDLCRRGERRRRRGSTGAGSASSCSVLSERGSKGASERDGAAADEQGKKGRQDLEIQAQRTACRRRKKEQKDGGAEGKGRSRWRGGSKKCGLGGALGPGEGDGWVSVP